MWVSETAPYFSNRPLHSVGEVLGTSQRFAVVNLPLINGMVERMLGEIAILPDKLAHNHLNEISHEVTVGYPFFVSTPYHNDRGHVCGNRPWASLVDTGPM